VRSYLPGLIFALLWFGAGIAFIWLNEIHSRKENLPETTVGDALLNLLFGAPFLPLIVIRLLSQVPLSRLRLRRHPPRPKPDYVRKAEAEVDGWLSR
jgi:hypothetical protein